MMETTDFWDRDDWPGGCSRDRSVIWRVLLEAEVRSTPVIVPAVRREDAPEMCLVEDDHVIKHSRRIEPIRRSTYGFCHGLASPETTSAMPMPASRRWKTSP